MKQKQFRTAIPSGILWRVIANPSILFFLIFPFRLFLFIDFSKIESVKSKNAVPNIIPIVAGIHPIFPCSLPISIAGIIKDQIEAANITPAANPLKIFWSFGLISFLKKKTTPEPKVVAINGTKIPIIVPKNYVNTYYENI